MCDGDQLNVVADQTIIEAAKRELEITNTVPLYYELGKAPAHHIDRKEMFNGLKRAHENSGIGEVSNSLTKLFSKENPDRYAAAVLTAYNNWVNKIAPSYSNI